MKRNMDLIKAILLFAEEKCDGKHGYSITPSGLPGFENEDAMVVRLHARLLSEREMLKVDETRSDICAIAVKWEGHEFLDNARQPAVWNAAKKAAGNLSWSVFVGVLSSLASEYGKSQLSGILAAGFGG